MKLIILIAALTCPTKLRPASGMLKQIQEM